MTCLLKTHTFLTLLFSSAAIVISFSGRQTHAAGDFPAQARLYAGSTPISPSNINTDLSASGLQTLKHLYQGGVEITYPLLPVLNVGLRYSHRLAYAEESPASGATNYYGGITQNVMLGVLRVTPVKLNFLRVDGFAGVGAGRSTFVVKTSDQDGTLAPNSYLDWFATPMYSYGASVGVGFKKFFLYVEGGYEKNTISRLVSTGTINSTATSIDVSGKYVAIGLMFDGITATQK